MKRIILILFLAALSCSATMPTKESTSDGPTLYDEAPKSKLRYAPKYPAELKRKKIEGDVRVGFRVNREGNVYEIEIIKSDHQAFSREAKEAVRNWKFEPAKLNGKPVEFPKQFQIVLQFSPPSE